MERFQVTAYTDGACSGNPGPGGWGAVLMCGKYEREISGGERETTNNRMELKAVLEVVRALNAPCELFVCTDSQNVIGWLSKGWKRKNPAIRALCQEIEAALKEGSHAIAFEHVKGHSGDPLNERADALAVAAIPH